MFRLGYAEFDWHDLEPWSTALGGRSWHQHLVAEVPKVEEPTEVDVQRLEPRASERCRGKPAVKRTEQGPQTLAPGPRAAWLCEYVLSAHGCVHLSADCLWLLFSHSGRGE